jgi:nucleotidyltransferase/DNA polymerase involved in DNA repair
MKLPSRLGGRDRKPEAARKLAITIKSTLASSVGEALHCSIGISSNRFLAKIAAGFDKPKRPVDDVAGGDARKTSRTRIARPDRDYERHGNEASL